MVPKMFIRSLLLGFSVAGLAIACSQEEPQGVASIHGKEQTSESTTSAVQLRKEQALAYARLFSANADNAGRPDGLRSLTPESREISHLSYAIDGRDTLLYAINYKGDAGFIIIAGDNSEFPIIAHSEQGNLDFDKVPQESPLSDLLARYKEKVKANLQSPERTKTDYFEAWKDLGKEGYEYEVSPTEASPRESLRGRRRFSSAKQSVHPSTGMALNGWDQAGTFNEEAKNKAAIGCPAVAIGMLLYDCAHRPEGQYILTTPSVGYNAPSATANNEEGKSVSKVLRRIADSIPNYVWGASANMPSVAQPEDILKGLKRLGFKDATLVPYDFEILYKNLLYKSSNYFGDEVSVSRGVLIGGYSSSNKPGHIWFCDGYYEQGYTVKKKFLGITTKSWREYDDRLYMNWGWGPEGGNGWFSATEPTWTSLEAPSQDYKSYPLMVVNLQTYRNI